MFQPGDGSKWNDFIFKSLENFAHQFETEKNLVLQREKDCHRLKRGFRAQTI